MSASRAEQLQQIADDLTRLLNDAEERIEDAKVYLAEHAHAFHHRYPAETCPTCFHIKSLEAILGVPQPPQEDTDG